MPRDRIDFHCKNKESVARLKKRLTQDGYLSSGTLKGNGFIVEIVGVDDDRASLIEGGRGVG